jgi:(S)-mandelate dehydrogenase
MLSCVADYRIAARKRLPRLAFDYLDGGAEDGDALRRNAEAYRQWLFKPRVLTDVSCCSSATQFFGREAAAPLIVGPTGLNGLFWPRVCQNSKTLDFRGSLYPSRRVTKPV